MICVEHLTKRYGSHAAVEDLSFEVAEGQVYGLLGPNGAGKSTTMNILTGYISATSGRVVIDGHDIREEPLAAKRAIGYLPEVPPLYQDMTVWEYLDFAAELKGCKKKALRAEDVTRVMERTGLVQMENRLIRNLSKGYRQRVGLAGALLGNPRVIILDEPTVGLDPMQMIEIRSLIKELGKQHTVILSSHILSEVQAVCDHVLIISGGRLAAQGTPEQLAGQLTAGNVLHATAQGNRETVVAAAQTVAGLSDITAEILREGEVTLTARSEAGQDLRAALSEALAAAGCPVLALNSETMSLEEVFLKLTGEDPETSEGAEPAEQTEPMEQTEQTEQTELTQTPSDETTKEENP